ncbi:putative bifunctional diguanylate cyclase/phosphodiesterase [Agarivorans sp. MS3-6]|uniref:putative bifunctional diguanylate cyclase/phosphodiesterase n=1 Tax=Agarivorans sp. TSD2052 TaxID=2937286 RepID=UPI00200C2416|nr:GGDEF domain-containing phosphodiesterase [Agarivorans sp. TSD2052]UPW19395.1 EAL domain-containing protein [Agarivorans sp. TSD2052]
MRDLRLGLATKALLLLCGVLLITLVGLISFNHDNLKTFFRVGRAQIIENQQYQLHNYYREVFARLQNINDSQSYRFDYYQPQQLPTIFDSFWQDLRSNSELPVRSLSIIDPQDGLKFEYGYLVHSEKALEWMLNPPDPAGPNWILDCPLSCRIIIATEFDNVVGNEDYRAFYSLDSLRLLELFPSSQGSHHFLVELHQDSSLTLLYAESDYRNAIEDIIQGLTSQDIVDGIEQFNTEMGLTELHAFEVNSTSKQNPVYYAIVNDVSTQLEQLKNADYNNFLFGISAWIFAGAIVIFALSPSLRRVRRTIDNLPLLARSSHNLFRRNLEGTSKRLLQDESDELNHALIRLSYQLEALEQQLKSRAEELEWVANYDNLTDLPNRRKFERVINQMVHEQRSGCLLMVDLDNFKYVNDISGHGAGDEMLRQVSSSLERLLPSDTILARISGDEFAVYLEGTSLAYAEVVAQRIISMLAQVSVPGHEIIHTASACVGIVAFPEHGNSCEDLMAKADICNNQAKERGKNCVVSFQSEDADTELVKQHYWLDLAQNAIERDRLELFYQPIMNNKLNKVEHYEVLLRVRDDNNQLHSPYQLILAAEKNGQIDKIDLWVVQQALQQMETNLRNGYQDKLAINLSARSFCSEKVIARIAREFVSRNIAGDMIIFEITETAALPNMKQAEEHIRRLKALGCAIALDDFGVGYSSFHSLKQLPFDFLKIDGSFVREILNQPEDKVFIQALVGIANKLGHKTVAEFVESEALNEELISLGVDYSQGYYIGKPASARYFWQFDKASAVLALQGT